MSAQRTHSGLAVGPFLRQPVCLRATRVRPRVWSISGDGRRRGAHVTCSDQAGADDLRGVRLAVVTFCGRSAGAGMAVKPSA